MQQTLLDFINTGKNIRVTVEQFRQQAAAIAGAELANGAPVILYQYDSRLGFTSALARCCTMKKILPHPLPAAHSRRFALLQRRGGKR